MAQLRGPGSMTGVNLLAKAYNNNRTKDGKTHYVDFQVDARDRRGPDQTNLHLSSQKATDKNGKTVYTNGVPYSIGQFDEIVKAAGPNSEPITNKDGEEIGRVYAVKANVMPSTRGNGLVVNTKSLEQSEFKVDSQTMDNQFASMKAATVAAKSSQSQKAAAPEAQATAPEQAADVPVYEDEGLGVG